ncbi:MAG: hypothetical protein HW403_337 [Dehalococcoidia bacterium]|nr:hypothetical protein [Dehalococcoidia bacterium]
MICLNCGSPTFAHDLRCQMCGVLLSRDHQGGSGNRILIPGFVSAILLGGCITAFTAFGILVIVAPWLRYYDLALIAPFVGGYAAGHTASHHRAVAGLLSSLAAFLFMACFPLTLIVFIVTVQHSPWHVQLWPVAGLLGGAIPLLSSMLKSRWKTVYSTR